MMRSGSSVSRKWRSLSSRWVGLGDFVHVWLVHRKQNRIESLFVCCGGEGGYRATRSIPPYSPNGIYPERQNACRMHAPKKWTAPESCTHCATIRKRLEAHTQKAPENQRRKATYTADFPAFHPQKSGIVKLAKILHFMAACHFSIYYWVFRGFSFPKTSQNMTFAKSLSKSVSTYQHLFMLTYAFIAIFLFLLAYYIVIQYSYIPYLYAIFLPIAHIMRMVCAVFVAH